MGETSAKAAETSVLKNIEDLEWVKLDGEKKKKNWNYEQMICLSGVCQF